MTGYELPSDRTTAADRVPIAPRRHEFADGVYLGAEGESEHLPPRPRRPSGFEEALARRAAYWERMRRRHVRYWQAIFLVTLALSALLMVAVTR